MNASGQCSVPDCEHPAATSIELRRVCLAHFIITCYGRLEELSRSTDTWSAGGTAWESARSFIWVCVQTAANLSQQNPELPNLERARLVDIIISATDLGRRSRRSPRSPLAIAIRLISERPGHCWEEETYTLDISRHGARTKCQHVVKSDDILKFLRLDTGEQVEARVVWRRQTTSGTQQIGIEFL